MTSSHRFPFCWVRSDLDRVDRHGHKVFSTFSCGGGSSFGYKMAGFDVVGCVEIDKEMMELYQANHHPTHSFLEPIQEFKEREDYPDELYDLDILDGSPPCFAAGTPVLTMRGVLPIEQVRVGDLVLTHMRRWRRVTDTMSRTSPTVLLDNRIEVTPDHPFLARKPERSPEAKNLGEEGWVQAKDVGGMFLATPTEMGLADWVASPEGFEYSAPFWYMVGRWLGDGWVRYEEAGDEPYRKQPRYVSEQRHCANCETEMARPHARYEGWWTSYCSERCRRQFKDGRHKRGRAVAIICCCDDESEDLQGRLEEVGCHIGSGDQETVTRKFVNSKALVLWLMGHFGKGASGKTMPGFVFSMNREWRSALLSGYLDADGTRYDEGYWVATTVGRCLLAGMNLLASSLGFTTSIVRRKPNSDVIEGRKVNVSVSWHLSIREDDGRYTMVDEGMRWRKMRRAVVPASELTTVHDLTVEEDHSFVADGYVVHNCSTFSMAGSREEVWGEEKRFREGQAKQVLSDLFFDFLDVVDRLKPKVVVAENVKGMILGRAKGYCKLIRDRFEELGYDMQLFLLNAATMGVPQLRERVFFVARRRDLGLPALRLKFDEEPITFGEVCQALPFQDVSETEMSGTHRAFWSRTRPGDSYSVAAGGSYFNFARVSGERPCPTVLGSSVDKLSHHEEFRRLSWVEVSLVGSYPHDYDYLGRSSRLKVYCVGMSVPPVMTAQIAARVAEQWFDVPAGTIDAAWGA